MRKISVLLIITMLLTVMPFSAGAETGTDIVPGEYVKFGKYLGNALLWRCIKVDENGYYLLSDRIITLKSFDATGAKSNDPDSARALRGSDSWGESSLRTWLNSGAAIVSYKSGHIPSNDNVMDKVNGYSTEKGFLNDENFTAEERSLIKTVNIPTLVGRADKNMATEGSVLHKYVSTIGYTETNYEDAYKTYTQDKVFLPSIMDIELIASLSDTLGEEYYLAKPTKTAVDNSGYAYRTLDRWKNYFYWVRDPVTFGKGDQVRCVYNVSSVFNDEKFSVDAFTPVGEPRVTSAVAYNDGIGVRPALYIDSTIATVCDGKGTILSPYEFESIFDANTSLTLYKEGSLSAVEVNTSAVAGNKLMFNKPTGAVKYFHNDTEVTGEDGIIDGTVALPVSSGVNSYRTELWNNGTLLVESATIYGYGATDSSTTEQSAVSGNTAGAWQKDTIVKGYLTSGTADQTALANAVYDDAHSQSNVYTAIKEGVSSETYINLSNIDEGKSAWWSTDVLIDGKGTNSENSHIVYAHTDSAGANYFKINVNSTDNSVSVVTNSGTINTGIVLKSRQWYTVSVYYSTDSGKIDCYINNTLVCKDVAVASGEGLYFSMPYADTNKYYANTVYTSDLVSGISKPVITASVDDEADTITVTKTDMDEFLGYDVKVFVNGVATADTFLKGTASITGTGAVTVYVAVVDSDGNIVNGYYGPLKTEEFDMTLEVMADDEDDDDEQFIDDPNVPETLTGFGVNMDSLRTNLSDHTFAKTGSSVIFTKPKVDEGNTIKYYNNNVLIKNVKDYSTDSVSLPVTNQGNNLFVAREFDAEGNVVEKTAPVSVFGTTLLLSSGEVASNPNFLGEGDTATVKSYLDTGSTATDEQKDFATALFEYEDGVFNRPDVKQSSSVSAATILNATTKFTTGDYYIEYNADVFVNGSTVRDKSTIARLFSDGSNVYVQIAQDGKVYVGGNATDFSITPNTWHTFTIGIDAVTDAIDVYVDNVLIAKSIPFGGKTEIDGARIYSPLMDANLYFSNVNYYAAYTHTANPKITSISAGEEESTVTVATTDMEGYRIAFFVGDETEARTVVISSGGVATAELIGYGEKEVYAVAVDENGNILQSLNGPLKTSPIPVTLTGETPPPAVEGDLAEGIVKITKAYLADEFSTAVIAVIGVRTDGTIKIERYDFGASDAVNEKTFEFGTGYEKLYVWRWADFKPLCQVIQ